MQRWYTIKGGKKYPKFTLRWNLTYSEIIKDAIGLHCILSVDNAMTKQEVFPNMQTRTHMFTKAQNIKVQ